MNNNLNTAAYKAVGYHPSEGSVAWLEFYLKTLRQFPEGEWFKPKNAGETMDASICNYLADHRIIEVKYTPVYREGALRGVYAYYRYFNDLERFKEEIS